MSSYISRSIYRDLIYEDTTTTVFFYIKEILESPTKIPTSKVFVSWCPTNCIDEYELEVIKAVYEDDIEREEINSGTHVLYWKNCVINKKDIIEDFTNKHDTKENEEEKNEIDNEDSNIKQYNEKEKKKLLKEIEDECKANIRGYLRDIVDEEISEDEVKKWCKKLSKHIKKCAVDMYNDYQNGELDLPDLRKREGDVVREYMEDTIFPQLPQEDDEDE